MNKSKNIEVFTDGGNVREYKLFSARLPDYHQAYPIEDGYRTKISRVDYLKHQKTLLDLYEKCLDKGLSPAEVGLPALTPMDFSRVVFIAQLIDPEGQVIEEATAIGVADGAKSWEKAETAARQRLVAALGFSGDVFDEDEKAMADQLMKKARSSDSDDSAQQELNPEAEQLSVQKVRSLTQVKATQPEAPYDAEDESSVDDEAGEQVSEEEKIPLTILNQVRQMEELKGLDQKTLKSKEDAKAYLKQLHKMKPKQEPEA